MGVVIRKRVKGLREAGQELDDQTIASVKAAGEAIRRARRPLRAPSARSRPRRRRCGPTGHRLLTRAPRAIGVAGRVKAGLEDRADDLHKACCTTRSPTVGNPQGPLAPVLLVYLHPPGRTWPIRAGLNLQVGVGQPLFQMGARLLHGLPVNAGSAIVGAHLSERLAKVVHRWGTLQRVGKPESWMTWGVRTDALMLGQADLTGEAAHRPAGRSG